MQDCGISSALAMEMLQSCSKPSICTVIDTYCAYVFHQDMLLASVGYCLMLCTVNRLCKQTMPTRNQTGIELMLLVFSFDIG